VNFWSDQSVCATTCTSFRDTLDSARKSVADGVEAGYGNMKESLKTANPYLGEKLETTEGKIKETAADFEKKGFCEKYKEFNVELFRPFKNKKSIMGDIMSTLTLKPEDPKAAFKLWNALCFWLGVVDFVILFLISTSLVASALVVAACDGFLGYCFAYFFYFIFVCGEKKFYMLFGFVLIALYVCITIYLSYYNALVSLNILELVLNVLKTLFNTIIGYHAFLLFKAADGDKEML